jgi:hypothetical protein
MYIPGLAPWTFDTQIDTDTVTTKVKKLPCIYIQPAYLQNASLGIYCKHHRKVETLTVTWPLVVRISLTRPTHKEWMSFFGAPNKTVSRTRLCSNTFCDHPFHSMHENNRISASRLSCRNNYFKLIGRKHSSKVKAKRKCHRGCEHKPKCLPFRSSPSTEGRQQKEMLASICTAVVGGLQSSGICTECSLDFPVKTEKFTSQKRVVTKLFNCVLLSLQMRTVS